MRSILSFPIRSALLLAASIPSLPSRASAAPQSGPRIEVIEHCDDPLGRHPRSGVIQASDGLLYGTTWDDAANDLGAVFKVGTDGSNPTAIHAFASASEGVYANGLIEGSDGALYGTTRQGGANGGGVVFKVQRDGTGFVVLHDFTATTGITPLANVIQAADGLLYGTTSAGGANAIGVVFQMATDGSAYDVLFDFDGLSGYASHGLIQASDGAFYATCQHGGAFAGGTIFVLSSQLIGGQVVWSGSCLVSFDAAKTGYSPESRLIEGSDGALYGTTAEGGTSHGSLFKVGKDGSGFTVLKFFDATSGEHPEDGSGLVEGSDGALYGTVTNAGATGFGALFRCQKDGSGFTTLVGFDYYGESGWVSCGLMRASDGALYGTTFWGDVSGPSPGGTVYRVNFHEASSTNYGSGLAGTLGVPTFTSGDPVIGGFFGMTVDNSRGVPTPAALFLGLSRANIPVKGGTLLVGNVLFLLTTILPAPTGTLIAPLPDDPALSGLVLDMQWIEADPGAVKGLSFTPGLELVLGY